MSSRPSTYASSSTRAPRRRRLAAIVAALPLAVSACGSGGGSGDEQEITVLMEEISYTDNIREQLPAFEEETGITVNLETVPYADQASRILQEFSQGSDTYDVVFNDNIYGSGYFESGFVDDLAPLDDGGALDSFYAPYLAPMTTEDGAVYGLPVYGESTFLMYRTDLFQQYGIDGPPQTTAELEEAARTIDEGSGGEVAGITMRGAAGIHAVYPWAGLLRSFGGDFFDDSGEIALDSPEAVEATDYWATLLSDYGPSGVANFDWEQNRIAFTQGQAAMTIDATANGPFNEDEAASQVAGNVGYAPVPYAEGVEPGENTDNSLNVHALYLNANSGAKDAAWQFMQWATSQEVQEAAVASVEAVGVTNQAVLEGDAYAERYGAFQDAVLTQLETGNIDYLPTGPDANTVIVETGQALSSVLSGQDDAQSAMTRTAQSLRDQLG